MNGKTATTISVYQQPGANAVAAAAAVRKRMEELKAGFPTGLDYRVPLDTSLFTLNSIEKGSSGAVGMSVQAAARRAPPTIRASGAASADRRPSRRPPRPIM